MKSKFYTYVHCRPDKKGIESVFYAEIALISAVRQSGVNLTNLTDGGEGTSGLVFSAEARTKISEASKTHWEAKKQRQNIQVVT